VQGAVHIRLIPVRIGPTTKPDSVSHPDQMRPTQMWLVDPIAQHRHRARRRTGRDSLCATNTPSKNPKFRFDPRERRNGGKCHHLYTVSPMSTPSTPSPLLRLHQPTINYFTTTIMSSSSTKSESRSPSIFLSWRNLDLNHVVYLTNNARTHLIYF
jgi:hypothetical protein